MKLGQFLSLCEQPDDLYIYDIEGDYLDCGNGCHVRYLENTILKIWLMRDERSSCFDRICVQIDY